MTKLHIRHVEGNGVLTLRHFEDPICGDVQKLSFRIDEALD